MLPFRITPVRAAAASLVFLAAWPIAAWCAAELEWPAVADAVRTWGYVLTYFLGLVWLIWAAERTGQRIEEARTVAKETPGEWESNPFDLSAWYYGRRSPRLWQSLLLLLGYSGTFLLLLFL